MRLSPATMEEIPSELPEESLETVLAAVLHDISNANNFIMLNSVLVEESWGEAIDLLAGRLPEQPPGFLGGIPFPEAREEIPRLLHGIREGAERIERVAANLKRFLLRDPGRESGDLNETVELASFLLSFEARRRRRRILSSLGEGLPPVPGPIRALEQGVVSLLRAALDATKPGTPVCIVTTRECTGTGVILTISGERDGADGGDAGMPPPRDLLFERSRRVFAAVGGDLSATAGGGGEVMYLVTLPGSPAGSRPAGPART